MAVKTFAWFPSTYGFEVFLNLKTCLKKRRGEFKKTEIALIRVHLAYSGAKVPSCIYLGDLVTCTEDGEIRSVSRRLPDYPGELASMTRCVAHLECIFYNPSDFDCE